MALVDGTRHDVPDVLDWIQVWGAGRPVHSINAFIMQELLTHLSHMCPSIVMHQRELRAHCTSIWSHNGSHLMAVRVPLASTWRAVRPSKEMPPYTITDPPPNQSCWRMLQAAEHSPRCLQTLSRLSHVLSVNLLSSVKSTGRQ